MATTALVIPGFYAGLCGPFRAALVLLIPPMRGDFSDGGEFGRWVLLADVLSAIAGLVFAGFIFGRESFWRFSHARMLKNIPTARAASAAMGFCEMKGRARLAENAASGASILRLRHHPAPFYLEDESGRILVDPSGARIRSGMVVVQFFQDLLAGIDSMGWPRTLSGQFSEIVLTRRRRPLLLWFNDHWAQPEDRWLEDGDPIYAMGRVEQGPGGEPVLRRGRSDQPPPWWTRWVWGTPGNEGQRGDDLLFLTDADERKALDLIREGAWKLLGMALLWGGLSALLLLSAMQEWLEILSPRFLIF